MMYSVELLGVIAEYSELVKLTQFVILSAPLMPVLSENSRAMFCNVTLFVADPAEFVTAATSADVGDAFAVNSEIFTSAICVAPCVFYSMSEIVLAP